MFNFKLKKRGPARIAKRGGFTLIEMMVSVSIFVIVAFTVTATLIAISNANRKAQELKEIIDNLNFSIQSMVLRMREGKDYTCLDSTGRFDGSDPVRGGAVCTAIGRDGFGEAIVFHDPTLPDAAGAETTVQYYREETVVGNEPFGTIKTIQGTAGKPSAVTAPNVNITKFNVRVGGVTPDNPNKPFIVIDLAGSAQLRGGNDKTNFQMRTFVSQHKQ